MPDALLLAAAVAGKQVVTACCPVARRAGVRRGHSVAQARGMLAGRSVEVAPHRPERDAATLAALAGWANRFSPTVALDGPSGLLLDVAGCERLFRGEDRLVERLRDAVLRLRFRPRIAVAGTIGCAWALARWGRDATTIVAPGGERDALAPLPVAALRVDASVVVALHEVGVTRVGELLALPRERLSSRFGEALLHRLDQALGVAPEPVVPFRASAPLRAERTFDGPVGEISKVRVAARALLGDLAAALDRAGRGVVCLEARVARSDAPDLVERIDLSRPSADARHLRTVLDPRLERWNLGFGVEALAFVAVRTRRLRRAQETAWGVAGPSDELDRPAGEVLDALVARLGPDRVLAFAPVASHVPERAFRGVPPAPAHLDPSQLGGSDGVGGPEPGDGSGRSAPGADVTPHDRPSSLFESPEPAEATALGPDGPPARLRWRGEDRLVVRAFGPERIAPPWWEDVGPDDVGAASRDYFRVQDEAGRWLWIFRRVDGWFVHGEWS